MREKEYVHWMDGGREYVALSGQYRRELLVDYAQRYNLNVFVETGTCKGDTVEVLRHHVDFVYSIELSRYYYEIAEERFMGCANVATIYGDSAMVLSEILSHVGKTPCLFWLDAHHSDEMCPDTPSPLLAELKAVLDSGVRGVILVDDMDPELLGEIVGQAEKLIGQYPDWKQEREDCIIRAVRL